MYESLMSLLPLEKHHYFKCFLKERPQDPNRQGLFLGQKIKALVIKVRSPLSSASSCIVQHPKSCPAPLTAHSRDQGPAAPMGDAQLTQGRREQPMTQGEGACGDQIKGKAKAELKQANLPALRAGLAPKGHPVPRPYRLKETKTRLTAK